MMENNQRILNWLQSEKKKDDLVEKQYKRKIINEIKKIKKEEMFPQPQKITLWQKLKRIILNI